MLKYLVIEEKAFLKEALNKIDKSGLKSLIVIDNEKKILGTITDGDIRKYFIRSKSKNLSIKKIYNNKPKFIFYYDIYIEKIDKVFNKFKINILPVVDKNKKLLDCFIQGISNHNNKIYEKFGTTALVMAGGKGVRLKPFTDVLPKPLIPINGKPVIQIIIDTLLKNKFTNIFISTGYKKEIIKAYFEGQKLIYNLNFIEEDRPLGTAGPILKLDKYKFENVLVSNCDVMIEYDISKVMNFHIEKKFDITILGVNINHKIPYGVIDFENNGYNLINNINEKPIKNYLISSGIYIVKKRVINKFSKKKGKIDFNNFINDCIKLSFKVGYYKISEKNWRDIGQWGQYNDTIKSISDS